MFVVGDTVTWAGMRMGHTAVIVAMHENELGTWLWCEHDNVLVTQRGEYLTKVDDDVQD